MGAYTEVIGVSGLKTHAESFHAKGATVAKRTEEVESRMTEATDAKNSERLVTCTVSGQETAINNGWESDELEEEDTMDGKKGMTEELANNCEKTGDTEDDSNTTSTTGGKDGENGKEIKQSNGQENPKNQDTDEELASAEEAAKEKTTEEKKRMTQRRRTQRIAI